MSREVNPIENVPRRSNRADGVLSDIRRGHGRLAPEDERKTDRRRSSQNLTHAKTKCASPAAWCTNTAGAVGLHAIQLCGGSRLKQFGGFVKTGKFPCG